MISDLDVSTSNTFNFLFQRSGQRTNLFMNKHMLAFTEFIRNTEDFPWSISLSTNERLLFRPLVPVDIDLLTEFLEGLSLETRKLSTFDSYNNHMAAELCDAIDKYDKLRFVLVDEKGEIVGLVEFTFDIPIEDIERYAAYGVNLIPEVTCRFSPTLADTYQSRGVGSLLFPFVIKIARALEKQRIILYGGVLADNIRAINYYQKHGFVKSGTFINSDNKETVDMMLDLDPSA